MRIAVLTSRFPYPLEKGDKLRIYNQLESLATRHEIHLFSVTHREVSLDEFNKLQQICHQVTLYRFTWLDSFLGFLWAVITGRPFSVGYFYSPLIKRRMRQDILNCAPDAIYCQLIRMAPYAIGLSFYKVLDYMDAFSLGMQRNSEESGIFFSALFKIESHRLKLYERYLEPLFNKKTIISAQDRDSMDLDKITVISNGIDTEYFKPSAIRAPGYDLVFVGNLGYLPNVQAVLYLANEILPLLPKGTTLLLAGARPHKSVLQLSSKGITVKGWQEDIRNAYSAGRVFVAPIFSGSGQQNKILEAMSMGLPCVTTDQVNNSIGAGHASELFIADKPEEIAKYIIQLLNDKQLRVEMGNHARHFVEKNYQWSKVNELLSEQFEPVAVKQK